jgi:hypothetical protein
MRNTHSGEPSLEEALLARPTYLGHLESELAIATPRPQVWCDRQGNTCKENPFFSNCLAVRGWICRVDKVESPSPDPGADYHIWYAYTLGDQTTVSRVIMSRDILHWAHGDSESYRWFCNSIIKGFAVTVLVDPDNNDSEIYGLLDPYVPLAYSKNKTPRWAAQLGRKD